MPGFLTPFAKRDIWGWHILLPFNKIPKKQKTFPELEDLRQEEKRESIWRMKSGENWRCWFEDGEKGPEAEEYGQSWEAGNGPHLRASKKMGKSVLQDW